MKTKILNITKNLLITGLFFFVGAGILQAAGSWTAPSVPAPGGNVDAPIHAGLNSQSKLGQLMINTDTTNPFAIGLVSFGKTVLNGAVQINSGAPQAGQVLAAVDAQGNLAWADNGSSVACGPNQIPIGGVCKYMRVRTETVGYDSTTIYDASATCETPSPYYPRTTVSMTDSWPGLNSDFKSNPTYAFTTTAGWGARAQVGKVPAVSCWRNPGDWDPGVYIPVEGDGITATGKGGVNSLTATKLCELRAGPEWYPTDVTYGGWSSPSDNYLWFYSEPQNRFYALGGWGFYHVQTLKCTRSVVTFF